jgi:hypothetical protein
MSEFETPQRIKLSSENNEITSTTGLKLEDEFLSNTDCAICLNSFDENPSDIVYTKCKV